VDADSVVAIDAEDDGFTCTEILSEDEELAVVSTWLR
jgi:hypothetical protein